MGTPDADASSYLYRFFYPLQVRFVETDQQGHVFFGHYFTYFDIALTEYLKAIDFGYDHFKAAGIDFYYAESCCRYRHRALFDDLLHVHTKVDHIGNTSFTLRFAVFNPESERLIATGHIVAVAVDPTNHRPVPVPDSFRRAVARFENPDP